MNLRKAKFLFLLVCTMVGTNAQTSRNYAIEIQATVDKANRSITLNWLSDASFDGPINIYRKKKDDLVWSKLYKTIPLGIHTFTDTGISLQTGMEYFLKKNVGNFSGHGYIYVASEIPLVEQRGKVLLVIEKLIHDSVADELNGFENDLMMDGWMVLRKVVDRNDPVDSVKKSIKTIYNLNPDLKSLVLIGHIPVPYSGLLNPDGHPDHKGAWPCDGFYGDVFDDEGNWTDIVIKDTTSASRRANRNWSNDGKYDNSVFPSDVELQVGRIDVYDMPSCGLSEPTLMKLYLRKNKNFRHAKFRPAMRALVDDNFASMQEAFAGNGYRNFAPLLGTNSYSDQDYITSCDTGSYIWSYGCGPGSYNSSGGIGTTSDIANSKLNTVFTMLFGSYFGDWDITDNFLRAPIAAPGSMALTCVWAGRPWWMFHHMALGEPIGFSTRLSMNNQLTYGNEYNFASGMVHVALMGDPTLRMHVIDPVDSVYITQNHGGAFNTLNWNASLDKVDGYMVYRKDSLHPDFTRITNVPVQDTLYTDNRPVKGENIYMVKAYRLEETPSGSYYNQSLGSLSQPVRNDSTDYQGISRANFGSWSLYPNPANDQVTISRIENAGAQKIQICDISGKLVQTLTMLKGQTMLEWDVQGFTSGVYLVKISDESGESVRKLVISH